MHPALKKRIKKMLIKPNKSGNAPKEEKLPFEKMGSWKDSEKPIAFMFGFNPWKREHITRFFPEYRTAYVFGSAKLSRLQPFLTGEFVFIVWGFKEPEEIGEYAREHGIKLIRTEDGFVRSLSLGAAHTPPMSIVADEKTLYFDSRQPSRLEEILNSHDFSATPGLLERSTSCIEKLINTGISKYNHVTAVNIENIYGKKTKKRILVIGQVEEDASIKYGCDREITNNELVWAAYHENPDAEIIYKPHPDVLEGHRNMISDPKAVEHIAKVIRKPLSLVDSFETIDHVYTITSLSGFEALIRGISVTCFGLPFYAGWGLTDDRQENTRRNRTLTVEELFAGAYLLYPKYISLKSNKLIDCESAIDELLTDKIEQAFQEAVESRDQDRYANMVSLLHKAIKLNVNSDDHLLKLAELAKLNKQNEEAISYYRSLLGSSSNRGNKALALYRMAEIKIFEGSQHVEIKKSLYASTKLANNPDAKVLLLSYLWQNEGLTDECLEILHSLEKDLDSLSGADQLMVAAVYNNAGYYNKAIGIAEQALKKNQHAWKGNRYFSLLSTINQRRPELIKDAHLEYEYYNKLKEHQGSFERMVREAGGNVCIIGMDRKKEEKAGWIDSRNLVIRLDDHSNDFPWSEHYGLKTDITIENPDVVKAYRKNSHHAKLVIVSGRNIEHTFKGGIDFLSDFIDRGKAVETIPHYIYTELFNRLEKKPSIELQILFWIYKIQGPIEIDSILAMKKFSDAEENSLFEEITTG